MSNPEVSLIFCTRNRARQLGDCLDRIARVNSSLAWELVVVDNGSTDDTNRILSAFAARVPFPVKVLHEAKPGKSRGLNRAVGESSGDIIAFIDDDVYIWPDHIDRAQEIFADSRIGFAGGRVELFDPTDIPWSIQTSTERKLLPPRSYVEPGWLLGANMIFRRQALEAIGGFDPELGPGTRFIADDPDVQQRASFAGWWGLYSPDIVVGHHHRRKANDVLPLMRDYSMGGGAYFVKFLLGSETRPIFLQIWTRKWYWDALRLLRGGSGARNLWWEVQGAVWYLLHRLRGGFIGGRA